MLRNMKLQWLLDDLVEHEKEVGLGMYNRKNLLWRWVSSTAMTGVFSYLVVLNRDVEWSALEICAIAYAVTTMTFFFMCMLQIDDIKLGLLVATLHMTTPQNFSVVPAHCKPLLYTINGYQRRCNIPHFLWTWCRYTIQRCSTSMDFSACVGVSPFL